MNRYMLEFETETGTTGFGIAEGFTPSQATDNFSDWWEDQSHSYKLGKLEAVEIQFQISGCTIFEVTTRRPK